MFFCKDDVAVCLAIIINAVELLLRLLPGRVLQSNRIIQGRRAYPSAWSSPNCLQADSAMSSYQLLGISLVKSCRAPRMAAVQPPWAACGTASVCSWGNSPPCISVMMSYFQLVPIVSYPLTMHWYKRPAPSASWMNDVLFYPNHIDLKTSSLQTPPSSPKPNTTSPPLKTVMRNSRGDFFCQQPGHSVNLVQLPVFSYFVRKRTRATKTSERDLRETKRGLFGLSLHMNLFHSLLIWEKKLQP